tara:strand:+ start:181 stop:648 length:468 start_codon:yes stop_codon:yes gene_type:complete
MIKYIKITLLVLMTIVLTECSYKPTMTKKNYNFSIESVNLTGDNEINTIIERQLEFLDNKKDKKYYISGESTKQKIDFSKDSKGDTLKFEIIISLNLKIKDENKILLEKTLVKKSIYNNISDKFKLESYEDIIAGNLSEKIVEEIIKDIANINDN